MRIDYERACNEAGLPEETVKAIRRIFDADKKRMKWEKKTRKETGFVYYSIELLKNPEDGCYYDLPDPEMDLDEIIIHKLDLERLSVILDMLPETEKQFILDCFDADYGSYKEIAKKYGMSVGTVQQKKRRVVERIRKLFFEGEKT